MKYIDADKLIAEIYKCREDALSVVDIDKANNLIEVIELIEDLQQEQPLTTEKVVEQCKKFGGNPEIIYQEQPEVDYNKFEKLFDDFCERNKGHHITSHDACMWFWELGLKARKDE